MEVAAAIWRKHRIGELNLRDTTTLISAFQLDRTGTPDIPALFIAVAVVDPIIDRAAELTGIHGLRAYDAVQLASALATRAADTRCDTFASFDQNLTQAAISEGFDSVSLPPAARGQPDRRR